jgi:acyl dehydratase
MMTGQPHALSIGDEHVPFVDKPLTRTDFVRYQGASGDMNPIHHDELFAMAAGFPSVFAPGMFAAGVLGSYLVDWLGPENVRRFKVQFRDQAWPDDVLTYTARVVDVRAEADGNYVDLETACTRQTGGVHIKGWATFILPH